MDLAAHRADLLRHCYRMLGSFADAEDLVQDVLVNAWRARASYAGDAPLGHWLMRIATNACLNELARRRRRGLPQLERAAAAEPAPMIEDEAAAWITPAADAALETREHVALAFIALLQRLPPKQRAVLLLKDVVGWSAEEVAAALELTVSSVNSALHRARSQVSIPRPADEPSPELVRAFMRSWETRDVDGLVALLRDDVEFAMPPHATWFRGLPAVEWFVRESPFAAHWTGYRTLETRANGAVALGFYRGGKPSSIQVIGARDGKIAEMTSFIGPQMFRGFGLPAQLDY